MNNFKINPAPFFRRVFHPLGKMNDPMHAASPAPTGARTSYGVLKRCWIKLENSAGFTFMELLIILAVIGILTVGVISVVNPVAQFQKAQDAQRKSDLSQIQKALETFYQDYGKYPDMVDNKIRRSDGSACSGNACAADWGSSLWAPYMSTLPKDPSSSKNYVYYIPPDSNGQTYYIYASLDREKQDLQACFSNGSPCSSAVTYGVTTACGGNCNYGVSTPNVSP